MFNASTKIPGVLIQTAPNIIAAISNYHYRWNFLHNKVLFQQKDVEKKHNT